MDHFEQGLRGEVKQIIAEYTYDSFQEMYHKAVKIARIVSETEIKNREKDQVKEKFGLGGSNSQGNRNFRRFKHGTKQDKGKQAVQSKPRKTCSQCGRHHPGPYRSFRAHVLNVMIWATKPLIAQGQHGIIRVIFRDLECESTKRHNRVILQLVLPQEIIETIRHLKREVEHSNRKEIPLRQYQVLLLLTIFILAI